MIVAVFASVDPMTGIGTANFTDSIPDKCSNHLDIAHGGAIATLFDELDGSSWSIVSTQHRSEESLSNGRSSTRNSGTDLTGALFIK